MAFTESTTGTVTTDGTEQDIISVSAAGTYLLYLDTNAMASGDKVEIRIYIKPKTGATERLYAGPGASGLYYADAQEEMMKCTLPLTIIASAGLRITIKRVAGTDRAYPYWLDVQ